MAHGYRTLQQWNQWLDHQFLGQYLLQTEQNALNTLLKQHYGKHSLLIGVPSQYRLLENTNLPCHWLITPVIDSEKKISYVEGDLKDLPFLTGSLDVVILPHTLEFINHPRQLLAEACRVIKPEGLIVICGFNPYSLWGIHKLMTSSKTPPWSSNFIQAQKIKHWLRLADFIMEDKKTTLFRPPIKQKSLFNKIDFMEKMGQICFPIFGGVYILVARAKVIPLTPIKMKWKQQLSGIRISTSISGHIARRAK